MKTHRAGMGSGSMRNRVSSSSPLGVWACLLAVAVGLTDHPALASGSECGE